MSSTRTIVIGPTIAAAKAWCVEHRVAPHSRRTLLRSTRESLHSVYQFDSGDWLVILPGVDLEDLAEVLYPALITAPGRYDVAQAIRDWMAAGAHGEPREAYFGHEFGNGVTGQ